MKPYALFPALLALVASAGCAHESAEERQIASLREEVNRLQAERDTLDSRVAELEIKAENGQGKPPAAPGASGAPANDSPTPKLRVVHLNPDGTEQVEEATTGDDPQQQAAPEDPDRPSIRISGSPPSRWGRGGSMNGGNDNGGGTSSGRPSALDPEAKRSYESALALVGQRQYDKALEAFSAFMVKWPDHPYVENATFWRGECYFAKGEYARAADQFEGVVARFTSGNKAPDALLKLSQCQQKLGENDKARATIERLRKEYPRSDAARRAPNL